MGTRTDLSGDESTTPKTLIKHIINLQIIDHMLILVEEILLRYTEMSVRE